MKPILERRSHAIPDSVVVGIAMHEDDSRRRRVASLEDGEIEAVAANAPGDGWSGFVDWHAQRSIPKRRPSGVEASRTGSISQGALRTLTGGGVVVVTMYWKPMAAEVKASSISRA